jgi:hypothetical protein
MKRLNIQRPIKRRTIGSVFGVGILGILLTCAINSSAQTNAPSRTDYSSYRIIIERNIFNPNRTGRYIRSNSPTPRASRVDTFSLVGTIAYEKGMFAFFDSSSPDFRKILEPAGEIAGYTVKEISPKSVKLEAAGKTLEIKIGGQMRREDNKPWELIAQTEWTPIAPSDSATTASNDSSLEANDVLKKLMQKREQESK